MEIAHRDHQDFKNDKLVAMQKIHVPLIAQVTHLSFVRKGEVWQDFIYPPSIKFIECFMNISLY